MKYPNSQFEKLVTALKTLSTSFDLTNIHPCQLHYIVFQQGCEGQSHNWLYSNGDAIMRAHAIDDLTGWDKLIDVKDFPNYPDGCNDNHIETAVKKALKLI